MHYSEHSVCMCRRADRKLTGTAQQTDSEVLIEVHILTWNRILLALCKLSSVYPNVARTVSREAHTRRNILLSENVNTQTFVPVDMRAYTRTVCTVSLDR